MQAKKKSTLSWLGRIGLLARFYCLPAASTRTETIRKMGESEDAFFVPYAVKTLQDFRCVAQLSDTDDEVSDDVRHVCWESAIALGVIGDDRAVNALMDALDCSTADADTKLCFEYRLIYSVEALGRIGSTRAVDRLLTDLKGKFGWNYIAQRYIEALGKIGDRKATPALIDILNDESSAWGVKMHSAISLMQIGGVDAARGLLDSLSNEEIKEEVIMVILRARKKGVALLNDVLNAENSSGKDGVTDSRITVAIHDIENEKKRKRELLLANRVHSSNDSSCRCDICVAKKRVVDPDYHPWEAWEEDLLKEAVY